MTQGKDAIIAEAEKTSMAEEYCVDGLKEDCGSPFARADLERAIRVMGPITLHQQCVIHADATRDVALDAAYEVEAQPTAYAGPNLLEGWRRRMAQEIANHASSTTEWWYQNGHVEAGATVRDTRHCRRTRTPRARVAHARWRTPRRSREGLRTPLPVALA